MNGHEKLKFFTTEELTMNMESERRERLLNGLEVENFRVYFQRSDLTVQIEDNGEFLYYIDLESCTDASELLVCILNFHNKKWGRSGGLLAAVLTIIDDACYEMFGTDAESLFAKKCVLNWKNLRN